MFYSASTGGFYSSSIHRERPSDCVKVSGEEYAALMAAQAAGQAIVAGKGGKPVAADHAQVVPDLEGAARARRAKLLASSDWTQVGDSPLSKAKKAAWAEYRQQLRDLFGPDTDWATIEWPSAPGAS